MKSGVAVANLHHHPSRKEAEISYTAKKRKKKRKKTQIKNRKKERLD